MTVTPNHAVPQRMNEFYVNGCLLMGGEYPLVSRRLAVEIGD